MRRTENTGEGGTLRRMSDMFENTVEPHCWDEEEHRES